MLDVCACVSGLCLHSVAIGNCSVASWVSVFRFQHVCHNGMSSVWKELIFLIALDNARGTGLIKQGKGNSNNKKLSASSIASCLSSNARDFKDFNAKRLLGNSLKNQAGFITFL